MSNVSYVRFENTYRDLLDCKNHINDKLSKSEKHYRNELVSLCQEIINEAEDTIEDQEAD